MKALWLAAGIAVLAAGGLAPSAQAEGPRASHENNWPGIRSADPGTVGPSAPAAGPRASSENNWPGIRQAAGLDETTGAVMAAPSTATAAAPHYVWQEGYDRHQQWTGHWALVR